MSESSSCNSLWVKDKRRKNWSLHRHSRESIYCHKWDHLLRRQVWTFARSRMESDRVLEQCLILRDILTSMSFHKWIHSCRKQVWMADLSTCIEEEYLFAWMEVLHKDQCKPFELCSFWESTHSDSWLSLYHRLVSKECCKLEMIIWDWERRRV